MTLSRLKLVRTSAHIWCLTFLLGCLCFPLMAKSSTFDPGIEQLCDAAALRASRNWNVPLDVLLAISLTETGRKSGGTIRPWPWTVNMEGKGVWFKSSSEARAYVREHQDRGARSFDVGCFQINHRWHGQHFSSVDAMFDPVTNADYAAQFLSQLFSELGDWGRAAGAYHSRTPELATKYRTRFARLRKIAIRQIGETDRVVAHAAPQSDIPVPQPDPAPTPVRRNTFPLLVKTGRPSSLGSLVPTGSLKGVNPLVPAG